MLQSPALWGATVGAQLETLRADLRILNSIKQTAIDMQPGDPLHMAQQGLIDKIDGMINRRLDVMISLETSVENA